MEYFSVFTSQPRGLGEERSASGLQQAITKASCTASSASALSLLVLRDSFGEGLFPYLATLTGRMTYSRVYDAPLAQARKAQAEMVILEIAERNLKNLSHALEEVSTDGRMIPP